MTVIINGTTGITNVNGTAAAPAETGTDTDSGIVYGTNTVSLATNGTTAVTVDASQNVGIGTASPNSKLTVGTASYGQAASVAQINGASIATANSGGILNIGSTDAAAADVGGSLGFTANGGINGYPLGQISGRRESATGSNYSSYLAFTTSNSGGTLAERMRIDSSGNVLVTNAAGLGYGTGSGGTVTQATNKGTPVTLNKPTGQITMNNAALAGGASIGFTLSNSLLATTDNLLMTFVDGSGTTAVYTATPQVNAGGAFIVIRNTSGTSYSEAIKWNFAVIKGATS